jgi:hypothetical protein
LSIGGNLYHAPVEHNLVLIVVSFAVLFSPFGREPLRTTSPSFINGTGRQEAWQAWSLQPPPAFAAQLNVLPLAT